MLETNVVVGPIVGSLLAVGTIGVLGGRARDRNSVIGILMPFGLGVLFLALYKGRTAPRNPDMELDHPASAPAPRSARPRRSHLRSPVAMAPKTPLLHAR
ncbi:hypothetical protein SCANM124S_01016 [Streptomyces canus]